MYRCDDCGLIFEEPRTVRECMGECWGVAAYEEFDVCPRCGGDYGECYEDEEEAV